MHCTVFLNQRYIVFDKRISRLYFIVDSGFTRNVQLSEASHCSFISQPNVIAQAVTKAFEAFRCLSAAVGAGRSLTWSSDINISREKSATFFCRTFMPCVLWPD